MNRNLYRFGMDWLNGVLPVQDVKAVFDLLAVFSSKLRFERWQLCNSGRYNYSKRFCLDGKASIQLMFNPVSIEEGFTACKPLETVGGEVLYGTSNNPYIFFSISGDGIRYLHSLGGEVSALNKLLFYFYRHGFKASRFDTYCDILDEDNTIVPLIQEAFSYVGREQVGKPAICTRLRRDRNVGDSTVKSPLRKNFQSWTMQDDNGNDFTNCQLGHHASTVGMFRCYNKLIEVRDSRLSEYSAEIAHLYDAENYWYRLEYEMHKDNANICFNALMSQAESCNTPLCFEDIFFSVFDKVFRIVVQPSVSYQLGSSPESPIWTSFRQESLANSIDLVEFAKRNGLVPYVRCSLKNMERNSERMSGYIFGALETLKLQSLEYQRRWWSSARDKFNENSRYNELRDEISDRLSFNESLEKNRPWTQSSFDDAELMAIFA